ncbi:hypothetical protein D9M72_205500 [compost metagenome]
MDAAAAAAGHGEPPGRAAPGRRPRAAFAAPHHRRRQPRHRRGRGGDGRSGPLDPAARRRPEQLRGRWPAQRLGRAHRHRHRGTVFQLAAEHVAPAAQPLGVDRRGRGARRGGARADRHRRRRPPLRHGAQRRHHRHRRRARLGSQGRGQRTRPRDRHPPRRAARCLGQPCAHRRAGRGRPVARARRGQRRRQHRAQVGAQPVPGRHAACPRGGRECGGRHARGGARSAGVLEDLHRRRRRAAGARAGDLAGAAAQRIAGHPQAGPCRCGTGLRQGAPERGPGAGRRLRQPVAAGQRPAELRRPRRPHDRAEPAPVRRQLRAGRQRGHRFERAARLVLPAAGRRDRCAQAGQRGDLHHHLAPRRIDPRERGHLHGRGRPDRHPRPRGLRRARRDRHEDRPRAGGGPPRLRRRAHDQPRRPAPAGRHAHARPARRDHDRAGDAGRPHAHRRADLPRHRRQRADPRGLRRGPRARHPSPGRGRRGDAAVGVRHARARRRHGAPGRHRARAAGQPDRGAGRAQHLRGARHRGRPAAGQHHLGQRRRAAHALRRHDRRHRLQRGRRAHRQARHRQQRHPAHGRQRGRAPGRAARPVGRRRAHGRGLRERSRRFGGRAAHAAGQCQPGQHLQQGGQRRVRHRAGLPGRLRAGVAGRGRGRAGHRPAGHARSRRGRAQGRHLHAAAFDLRAAARCLPRGSGGAKRAARDAAAGRLRLVRGERLPRRGEHGGEVVAGQPAGRHARGAGEAARQLQRDGLRRLRGGRRGTPRRRARRDRGRRPQPAAGLLLFQAEGRRVDAAVRRHGAVQPGGRQRGLRRHAVGEGHRHRGDGAGRAAHGRVHGRVAAGRPAQRLRRATDDPGRPDRSAVCRQLRDLQVEHRPCRRAQRRDLARRRNLPRGRRLRRRHPGGAGRVAEHAGRRCAGLRFHRRRGVLGGPGRGAGPVERLDQPAAARRRRDTRHGPDRRVPQRRLHRPHHAVRRGHAGRGHQPLVHDGRQRALRRKEPAAGGVRGQPGQRRGAAAGGRQRPAAVGPVDEPGHPGEPAGRQQGRRRARGRDAGAERARVGEHLRRGVAGHARPRHRRVVHRAAGAGHARHLRLRRRGRHREDHDRRIHLDRPHAAPARQRRDLSRWERTGRRHRQPAGPRHARRVGRAHRAGPRAPHATRRGLLGGPARAGLRHGQPERERAHHRQRQGHAGRVPPAGRVRDGQGLRPHRRPAEPAHPAAHRRGRLEQPHHGGRRYRGERTGRRAARR